MRLVSRLLHAALAVALTACGGSAVAPAPRPAPSAVAPTPEPLAIAPAPKAAARIAEDVRYLASPELGGRGTGEPGSDLAARYVARRFENLRLEPLGDRAGARSYLQAFPVAVGVDVDPPSLTVTRGGRDARADSAALGTAAGSESGEARGEAVFVGHGITASAANWDDYAGADLSGKIAIVLDGAPKPQGKAGGALQGFDGVRYKLRTAREHHAAGAVIVASGDALPAAPDDATSMGLPAVVLTRAVAKRLFPGVPLDARPSSRPSRPLPVRGERVAITTHLAPKMARSANVVGLLAADPASPHASEVVVVGAHYDHLGQGGRFALDPEVHAVHPGADDNASGTALLLEVARRMTQLPRRPARNVVFVAFGAEEIGAIGSRFFVDHPPFPVARMVAMLNADMVGRMREDRLIVDGVGTSPGWKPLVDRAADGLGLSLAFGAEGFGASDHASFTAARVPVAFFFTGVHDDYHRATDTADKIDANGIARTATLAARLALELTEEPGRLAFVDAPADPHAGQGGGFKVSLGTIPDYAWSGKGVRLSGVRPNAPAARAGLRAGDVIVKVGPHDVTNIHDYVFVFGELEPGKEVPIEIERDGARITLSIVPAPGR